MKEKLLEAAIRQYSQFGYQGATMQKIATDVGIKPASIYFFYQNKEAVFVAAFQRLLENHFQQMKRILGEAAGLPVEEVFSHLLTGTVAYHKENEKETLAYISLISSPPPEIKLSLKNHMAAFDSWLTDSLTSFLKQDYPFISDSESKRITRQFLLLMDGIFWEINFYDDKDLSEQIDLALQIIKSLLGRVTDEK
jgi:AcrR family transcriptional regulator